MSIAEGKIATRLVIPKELKSDLEQLAKQERRSLNNLMTVVLEEYVNQKKTQNEFFKTENDIK